MPQTLRPTKLHTLLTHTDEWDDWTWFQVERYLAANIATHHSWQLLGYAGLGHQRTQVFKIDNIRKLRQVKPAAVLAAWERLRAGR